MKKTREIEVYSAGCPTCIETIAMVEKICCESCHFTVHDMNQPGVADHAKKIGIHSLPAVVVDGEIATCCKNQGPTESGLRASGLGLPLA